MKPGLRLWHDRRAAETDVHVLEMIRAGTVGASVPSIVRATGYGLTRVCLSLARLEQQGQVRISEQVLGSNGNRRFRRIYAAVEGFVSRTPAEFAISFAPLLASALPGDEETGLLALTLP